MGSCTNLIKCRFLRGAENRISRGKPLRAETRTSKLNPHMTPSLEIEPGACFSKVPKLFGCISGDIIHFVSSKRRRLEARNFAVIFIFIPFTTYEKTSFTE